jgi:hypothetical protein
MAGGRLYGDCGQAGGGDGLPVTFFLFIGEVEADAVR